MTPHNKPMQRTALRAAVDRQYVEAVEKGRANNLQKKRPPYLALKRRSRIEEWFWYPQFGHFFSGWDFSYSLVSGTLKPVLLYR